jgi:hypothetical protein
LEHKLEKHAVQIAKRYVARALGPKGDKVLMHAIDRILPAAKREIELSGQLKVVRIVTPDLNG